MRHALLALSAGAALVAASLSPAAAQVSETAAGNMINADGGEIGTITFQQTPAGVLITTDISDLPEGEHGFHIHETGKCDASDGFKSAGGHYAGGMKHGFLVEGGPHPGDMPNVTVGSDGVLKVSVLNTMVSVKGGENPLLDDDGSALMIHSGADDYESQPAGDAGNRIACAVIE
ncbi:superoxide dismutase family protein [Acuticoccus sp. I52.16.1]|uniref:superoxide dismutase family protein n=1 Tax=Acuticoccus sp. I52.16.1 TaxID=2928472 RepID=UPI001FD54D49|nr:superoxide dismutase family protein [Acuticoccus sp. I52.16.1]UOM34125.1 superoxide dismutase family protein [Acuticoccus sp. I52.16.1]